MISAFDGSMNTSFCVLIHDLLKLLFRPQKSFSDWLRSAFAEGACIMMLGFSGLVNECASLVFHKVNRLIVTQYNLFQLLFWQILFLDLGKIYRVIDASTER